jgi:hypothetical protein
MRLALLIAALFAAGTWTVGIYLGMIPMPDQMLQTLRNLVADSAESRTADPARIRTVQIVPVRAAFDHAVRKVTVPENRIAIGLHGSAVPRADFGRVLNSMPKPVPGMEEGIRSNIAPRNQRLNDRMQDLPTYGRNPAASHFPWHGPPPQ